MHAKTYVGEGVDYALVFDDGRVALYPRGGGSLNGRLVGTMAAALDLVGPLRPYEKKMVLQHRFGQVFPLELEIDDKAIALLEAASPKAPPDPRERLAELEAERARLLAQLGPELPPVGAWRDPPGEQEPDELEPHEG